jgi:hypothetical protein
VVDHPDHLRNRVFCSACGTQTSGRTGSIPLGWQEMPDSQGHVKALCPHCVRRRLWLIEARLDFDAEDWSGSI